MINSSNYKHLLQNCHLILLLLLKPMVWEYNFQATSVQAGNSHFFRNSNPDVVCGQGTMGLEIVDQLEEVDVIILLLGKGTLLAGTCLAVKTLYPSIKIIVSTVSFHCSKSLCSHVICIAPVSSPVCVTVQYPLFTNQAMKHKYVIQFARHIRPIFFWGLSYFFNYLSSKPADYDFGFPLNILIKWTAKSYQLPNQTRISDSPQFEWSQKKNRRIQAGIF